MSAPAGYVRDIAAEGAIRLDLNEAPREAGAALRQALLERLAARPFNRYPEVDAMGARRAAAELYGWQPAGTLVGNGSNELLAAAVRALLPAGGTMLTLHPSFSMYPVLAARQGVRLATAELVPPRFVVDPGGLLAQAGEADLVVLCSPNNPTGGELEPAVFEAVLELGRPTIWDAAYLELSGADPRSWLARFSNLLVLRSFSKAWGMAGLRVGALLTSPELARRVEGELLPFGTSWHVEAAFQAALDCREEGAWLVAELVAERERVRAALGQVARVEVAPSAANFLLLRVAGMSGSGLAEAVARRGVAVRRIGELDAGGWVRATIGSRAENEVLVSMLREVANG
ncbi:MAG TPA: aminotransferase class I/II-fold pyridoxal phosphate-dependent enzyme [Thermoanaerobaculaceae bacterium]|nr:aminotransferase class I/II-fold pyridoxal phosphate-dependent enzyme [Thermoanaerobaculaceae bacterium]HRS17086.1 aminotransferase class I/II-fold pyridoxal phosphate-dependent enzyme [Thermoanaerobaculaceae bacterium]